MHLDAAGADGQRNSFANAESDTQCHCLRAGERSTDRRTGFARANGNARRIGLAQRNRWAGWHRG
jgi:hypothetical protein